MNLLVILANPKEGSTTRQLLDAFLTSYRSHHPSDVITELDLYRQAALPVIDDAVLQAWTKPADKLSPEEQRLLAGIDQYTEQFLVADKIVFAAPMWNLQFPPQLTAYIATLMVAGRTFAYTETGCQGLAADKPVLLLHVRGGIYSSGPLQSFDHAVPYLRDVCAMIGITNFQTLLCEGLEMFPDQAETILRQAKLQAAQLAEHF
jgi:FMN-dependent NADH-azoreductase